MAGLPRLITCSGRPRRIPTTPASARTGTARPAASSTSLAVSSGIYTLLSIHYRHSIYTYLPPRSPLMMSWPHFYQADPRLLRDVEGLQPDRDKHQFQLDILPVRRRGYDEDNDWSYNVTSPGPVCTRQLVPHLWVLCVLCSQFHNLSKFLSKVQNPKFSTNVTKIAWARKAKSYLYHINMLLL